MVKSSQLSGFTLNWNKASHLDFADLFCCQLYFFQIPGSNLKWVKEAQISLCYFFSHFFQGQGIF